jgi:hypothetical protein
MECDIAGIKVVRSSMMHGSNSADSFTGGKSASKLAQKLCSDSQA